MVIAKAADDPVIACATDHIIFARAAIEGVVAAIASEPVHRAIAGEFVAKIAAIESLNPDGGFDIAETVVQNVARRFPEVDDGTVPAALPIGGPEADPIMPGPAIETVATLAAIERIIRTAADDRVIQPRPLNVFDVGQRVGLSYPPKIGQ